MPTMWQRKYCRNHMNHKFDSKTPNCEYRNPIASELISKLRRCNHCNKFVSEAKIIYGRTMKEVLCPHCKGSFYPSGWII